MGGRLLAGVPHVIAAGALTLASFLLVPRAEAQESTQTNAPLELCVGCHAPGEAPAAPIFPSLSGQHAEYLVKQLRDYKRGRRLSPIMVPPLATVAERDIVALADFFASQKPVSGGGPSDPALAERGRAIYHDGLPDAGVANCAGCHEANGAGSGRYPRLAGFAAPYVEQQLGDFRTGARHNDRARVMRVVTSGMTDDDIRAVAEYIATLSGQP
jgi:cytochrome c553